MKVIGAGNQIMMTAISGVMGVIIGARGTKGAKPIE